MKKKICFIVAVPGTANAFLRDHISALQEDFDIYLAGNIKSKDEVSKLNIKDYFSFDIQRKISIGNDIKAVWQLYKYFKRMKFDAVHSVTPKAGMTTAIAAKMASIRHRTHIFTGQVWATRTGLMRRLLKSIDKITATLDNHILVDGESQRQYIINNNVVSDKKSRVLGPGSISGVNTERFVPDSETRNQVRGDLNLNGKVVFTFMGRANKEKGIYELFESFNNIASSHPEAFLLFFGSDEDGCLKSLPNYSNIIERRNFMFYGRTPTPGIHLQASDVFVMPSYREGFGTSVIEASCLGIPVICSDAYGVMDAMVDGETGLRCKVADVPTLQTAMETLLNDSGMRKRFGENGRQRVLDNFKGDAITAEWVKFYKDILQN